jgi:alginate O-acetyltransferase complex protein AlgI
MAAALAALTSLGLAVVLLGRFSGRRAIGSFAVAAILGVLCMLKSEPLGAAASAFLRRLAGQTPDLARAADLAALGFSYIAFRLIHTLLDRSAGRLPAVPLKEYVCYVLFFPALTAGPISRAQPFLQDLERPRRLSADAFLAGGQRILVGVFKKAVLADALALIALDARLAAHTEGSLWAWILLYAYSLRIYLDFSALTDIALGLAAWMGIRLPENFDRPYAKSTLTAFWNSWHITLAQWIRAYVYNPLTRFLRSRTSISSVGWIIFVGQLGTMLLIGVWHGLTVNFAIWGAWHALGLFIANRWNELRRSRGHLGPPSAWARAAGRVLTFHFVTLGWIWFALPAPASSLAFLRVLSGLPPR